MPHSGVFDDMWMFDILLPQQTHDLLMQHMLSPYAQCPGPWHARRPKAETVVVKVQPCHYPGPVDERLGLDRFGLDVTSSATCHRGPRHDFDFV